MTKGVLAFQPGPVFLRVTWNGEEIRFQEPRWVNLLELLAQQHQHADPRQRRVSVEDVAQLEGFRGRAELDNIGRMVSRFIRRDQLEKFDCELVLGQRGKSTQIFYLNPDVIERIDGLEMTPRPAEAQRIDLNEQATLARAEALFEAGQIDVVATLLEPIIKTGSSFAAAQALLLSASLHMVRGDFRTASEQLIAAQEIPEAGQDPEIKAYIQWQSARLEFVAGQLAEARTLLKALFTHSARENPVFQARLELLSGLLSLHSTEPLEARGFFEQAIKHSTQAHWWWGVQASFANLGLMYLAQADRYITQDQQAKRREHLTDALGWFQRSLELCRETGFSHLSPELLVCTARVKRLLGQVDQRAILMLDEALTVAKSWDSLRGQAEAIMERGEIAWYQGRSGEARSFWHQGLAVVKDLPDYHVLLERVRDRLTEVAA